ncbi:MULTISPECIES: urea transporter [unclassified Moorena]|uniref:urea transporter n=1 Tax=unclassified Moorena TaxID=2683338 RepID=UPI0013C29BF5|nr:MULTISPECIES: urea transporter [unclassified Moorena]NEO09087.1 urea transporter [Moorena sp. SIO3I8]NEO21768.1 urea transporter [Moorena sp. SIO4A5]NEP20724.1 urea transporter [Moorena sp. SIO3I6]NEQ60748.1 urea transporter [Moorena sp. SIO4A1]
MSQTSEISQDKPQPLPLHELLSRLLKSEKTSHRHPLPIMGTLQDLNQAWERRPLLDFINASLRGIGQVGFANNPITGLLITLAVFIQSPWVALMLVVGVVVATWTAYLMGLDRPSIRNGIFGLNGALVGLALGTFGTWGNGTGNLLWVLAVIICAALSTVLMQYIGLWMAVYLGLPSMGVPFHIVTYSFLVIALYVPQPFFELGAPPPFPNPAESLDGVSVLSGLITGIGQIFFSGSLVSALLIIIALALCSPMGALVAVLGSVIGLVTGIVLGVNLNVLYAGLWGYNSALTAIAIGGIFYTPNRRSLLFASGGAFGAALIGWLLTLVMTPLKLPILAMSFHLGTYACFVILQRSLSSLVPVAPYSIASPEEHRFRYLTAKEVISAFRRQLQGAMVGQHHKVLFDKAPQELKGDLRYIFDAIDRDQSGSLSLTELSYHFQQAGHSISDDELNFVFSSMDVDNSGEIDFEEFGELLLRHRRLMSRLNEFATYFIPIDKNKNGVVELDEMNVVLASVDQPPLSEDEVTFLQQRIGGKELNWEGFIELLLVI